MFCYVINTQAGIIWERFNCSYVEKAHKQTINRPEMFDFQKEEKISMINPWTVTLTWALNAALCSHSEHAQ